MYYYFIMLITFHKPAIRAFQGAIAAFGAPFGWLGIGFLTGADPLIEISTHPGLYLYMLFGTMASFSLFGWYVGEKEQHLTQLCLRDALTGLFNVRYFQERLNEEVQAAKRFNTPLTLISFDIDHFKNVNDTYGHPVGDDVLIAITKAASSALRKHEVLARVGGEEFAALLPRSDQKNGKITAERIRNKISSTSIRTSSGADISVTVSLGVAELHGMEDANTLCKNSDKALYQAKENGRNRTEINQDTLDKKYS